MASAFPTAALGQVAVHEIHEIQGKGPSSPHAGATVATNDNVVTAVGAGGFFIQTPFGRSDNDADTSVTVGRHRSDVGDQVDVVGRAEESTAPVTSRNDCARVPPRLV